MKNLVKLSNSSRRGFIRRGTTLMAGVGVIPEFVFTMETAPKRSSMGVAGASYANRWRSGAAREKLPGFENALQMLIHCESIGAAGVQVGSRDWSQDFTGKVRDFREKKGLYLEGSIRLPQNDADIERFTQEARNSKEAGAEILRTACLSGRRYENFETDQAFLDFKRHSIKSIERAIPVLERYRLKLAIENHKDWRIEDLMTLLKHFENELVGVNLDTGNNISFLEDPMQVVEKLAPYSFTTHLKDMGVQNYQDGFLLSEVPLGTGKLDLKKMVETCRKYNPDIRFNLEMITRNPLEVPCYKQQYWSTFKELPAYQLVQALKWIRDHQSATPLPSVNGMTAEEKLVYEEQNIIDSFNYAIDQLELVN